VEEDRSDIVQVAIQCEQASPSLVIPDLDLVVIASGHKQGLSWVEVNTTDRSIVLFESVNKCSHAVIPQLDGRGVEGDENPWPVRRSVRMLWLGVPSEVTDRFGWNAIPLALDDLDSN
jgi:hypothetical protein